MTIREGEMTSLPDTVVVFLVKIGFVNRNGWVSVAAAALNECRLGVLCCILCASSLHLLKLTKCEKRSPTVHAFSIERFK